MVLPPVEGRPYKTRSRAAERGVMSVKQITVYEAAGQCIRKEQGLKCGLEKDEPTHLESGVINLYPGIEYQTIEGFGGAMTESSAYMLMQLDEAKRTEVLKMLFGPDGHRLKYIRTCIDSCDFCLDEYQAVGDPLKDPDFTTFTIDRDRKYIIPMIKAAMKAAAQPLQVLLSPWSPPKQWKTPPARIKNDMSIYSPDFQDKIDYDHAGRCHGGSLKPEYYGQWAKYIAKYVQAYLDEGVPVGMVTIQNESIAAVPWDSCIWTAEEQKTFLRDYLYPEFVKAGLSDKIPIYFWDHNKERVLEWTEVFMDETTRPMIGGAAFHWYSGDHFEDVAMVHEKYPELNLMLSEFCCGMDDEEIPVFMQHTFETKDNKNLRDAQSYAHEIIGDMNAGTNRFIDWNFCLDKTGRPRHTAGGCNAGIIIDGGDYTTNAIYDYYDLFSHYILPGAKRIGLSRRDEKVEAAAVKNPDGSVVVELLNRGETDARYAFRVNGHIVRFEVPRDTLSAILLTADELT